MQTVAAPRLRVHRPGTLPAGNTISARELPALLCSRTGCTVISIVARTVPTMNKTGNPLYGRVEKLSRVNGMIGWQYENAVNNQRAREGVAGHFTAHARKWGQRLAGTPLVEHKGALYLELKVERSLEHQYLLDGAPVADDVVTPYLPERRESARQGVEREVILRDYRLDSIVQVTLGGVVYTVEHDEPAAAAMPLAKAA